MSPELLAEAMVDIASAEDFILMLTSGVRAFAKKNTPPPREETVGSLARVIPTFLNDDGMTLLAAVAITLLSEHPPPHWPEEHKTFGPRS